ncbi:MAG: hypothetical protein J7501_08400 [Bdellovibrio sp.]|nr:hypothetical protein [Bdellovibrio sp.]
MKIFRLAVTAALLLFSAKSMAWFYLEPGVFYEGGNSTIEWPAPLSDSDGTTKGFGVDLKIGAHFAGDMLFVALDGSYSKPQFENSANHYKADATSTTYGAIIGIQTPVLVRAWAGYVFGGTLDPDKDNGFDVKFEEAKGPKVGVGVKIAIVAINVEYMELTYSKGTIDVAPGVTGNLDDYKNKVGMLNVSFPFMF